MEIIAIAAAVIASAAALTFAAAYATFRIGFYSPLPRKERDPLDNYVLPPEGDPRRAPVEKIRGLITSMSERVFEPVTIESSVDGTKLFGRYYRVADGAPIQIECHGWRGHPMADMSGGDKIAREKGWNTLVIDERTHGKSGGTAITFGVKERFDIRDWAFYISGRFPESKIVLAGVSMGAAAVVMASELELPENVSCVIADAPYSSQRKMIEKTTREMHLPAKAAYPFVTLGAKVFGKFALNCRTPLEAAANAKKPILFIHGEADGFVPCEMSRELDRVCVSPHELHTFPGAKHCLSYITDTERYEKIVSDFFEKYI